MNIHTATEVAYTNGFRAGKKAAVERVIDMVKAENDIDIKGVTHYVVTDHQLEVIKNLILEEQDGTGN